MVMARPASEALEAAKAAVAARTSAAGQSAAAQVGQSAAAQSAGLAMPSSPAASSAAGPPSQGAAEWFVGIDGSPVGPVPPSFIKEQLDAGKITPRSLVWREDLTDWKPLAIFPELAALAAARTTVEVTAPAPAAPPAVPSPAMSDPVALTRVKAPPPKAEADPLAGFGLDDEATVAREEPLVIPEPEAAKPEQAVKPELAAPQPAPVAAKPETAAAAPTAPRDIEAPPDSFELPRESIEPPPDSALLEQLAGLPPRARRDRRRRSRGMNPLAYAFVAMAAGFGGVAAWVLLSPKPPPPVAAAHTAVAPTTASPAPTAAPTGEPTAKPESSSDEGQTAKKDGVKSNGTARPVGSAAKSSDASNDKLASDDKGKTSKKCNPLEDPLCEYGGTGPGTGPRSDSGDKKEQGLSAEQAQGVVSRYRHGVARACLGLVTKGSAKVDVTITVSPSGSVSGVSASGGAGHPGLAGCVSSRVRSWRFPSAGGSSTINVPFTLIAQ